MPISLQSTWQRLYVVLAKITMRVSALRIQVTLNFGTSSLVFSGAAQVLLESKADITR